MKTIEELQEKIEIFFGKKIDSTSEILSFALDKQLISLHEFFLLTCQLQVRVVKNS